MKPEAWELASFAAKAFAERARIDREVRSKPWERVEPPRRRDTKKGHRR